MLEPGSVLRGNACAICWRPIGHGIFYQQVLDNVSRNLCESCKTQMFPLPAGLENVQLRRLDVKAGLAEAERQVAARLAAVEEK